MNNTTAGGLSSTMDPGIMQAAWYNPSTWGSSPSDDTGGATGGWTNPSSSTNWTGISIVAVAIAATVVVLAIKF